MFALLLRHPAVSEVDWHSLRCGFSGGAVLRPETQARFLDATGAPLLNGYGITEATSFVAAPPRSSSPTRRHAAWVAGPSGEMSVACANHLLRSTGSGEAWRDRRRVGDGRVLPAPRQRRR